ncbi:MAG: hypothetical protein AB7R55_02950 [Gemmatimonadales bacterium]
MPLSVLSLLGDWGGAEAVLPVLARLRSRGDRVAVLTSPTTRVLVQASGFEALPPVAPITDDWADRLLREVDPSVILMGTSWGGAAGEATITRLARREGVGSIAVLDFWSNYRERFSRGGAVVAPDAIAVMDERARAGAIAAGLPADAIRVTGNPHYERLLEHYDGLERDARLSFRERVGVSRLETVVLFVSQPISALYGTALGYGEADTLALLMVALRRTAEWLGHPITLAVRSHPRDLIDELPPPVRGVTVRPAHVESAVEWALAADLVVGMTSAVLVQAAMLGARVLCLEPGAERPTIPDWPMPEPPVMAPAGIANAVYERLAGPANRAGAHWTEVRRGIRGATNRVVAEVERLAGAGRVEVTA